MELEQALAAELSRICAVVDGVSREIASPRPWWVRALGFLRQVVI